MLDEVILAEEAEDELLRGSDAGQGEVVTTLVVAHDTTQVERLAQVGIEG